MDRKDRDWVPDKLPQFPERNIPVSIVDTQLAISVLALSSELGIENGELLARFLKFGLLLKIAQQDPNSIFARRDDVGNETNTSEILDDLLKQSNNDPGIVIRNNRKYLGLLEVNISTTRKGSVRLNLPGQIANEFIELANMYHTSLENILAGTLKFGVLAANEEKKHSHNYFFRNPEGENHMSLYY